MHPRKTGLVVSRRAPIGAVGPYPSRWAAVLLLTAFAPLALSVVGCSGAAGQNAASHVLKTPELPTDKQSKCRVAKSQSEPLIVEWADTDRARLESLSHKGLVAVHYEGCTLRLLSRCSVKGAGYSYSPVTRRVNKLTIKDEDDLFMKMPYGAVALESKLRSAGQLNVQMTTVGRYEAPIKNVYRDDLEGDCSETTHIVQALTVGAFTFSAGSDAEVGAGANIAGVGGGAKSTATHEVLQKDGDESACSGSTTTSSAPPEGCTGPFQIEVMPLAKGPKPVPVAPPAALGAGAPSTVPSASSSGTAGPLGSTTVASTDAASSNPSNVAPSRLPPKGGKPPHCKRGERIEDGVCVKVGVKKRPPTVGSLSSSSHANPTCAPGQHAVNHQCVDDEPLAEPAPTPPTPTPPAPTPPAPNQEFPSCVAGTHVEEGACVVDRTPTRDSSQPQRYDASPEANVRPNPFRAVLLYGAYGFGLTALVAGPVALAAAKTAKESCSESTRTCGQDYEDKRSTAMTAAVVADVALGLAVLSVVGVVLLPQTVKVGAAPTRGGVFAGLSAEFR